MAEQTRQYAGRPTRVVLIDPAQAVDTNPRVLTRLTGLEQGLKILSRLATGDQSALAEVGVETVGGYDTRAHEWAVGRDRGDRTTCYLIAGGPTQVDWSQPVLKGLVSIAHSHPFVKADRGAFRPDAAPLVLQDLTAAQSTGKGAAKLNITLLQNDLGYLFPSNQDLAAAYRGDFERPEVVYSPYRLGPDGRLSLDQGGNISVKYGPVLATLTPAVETSVRAASPLPAEELNNQAAESIWINYFWCGVEFFADHKSILTGTMQAAPPKKAKPGERRQTNVELAWFFPSPIPVEAQKRSDMLAHITNLQRSAR
ncbi:hypothetical protein Caci_2576 [Catenulispora acidiphila DSM 44928]|uniref:Uncharacterized protein n=1 Tax=Catenulispora acidiphila (strain DSM 44928 / JCM 14897 / NBRC 102108 / NRRL B-24433 / ID139908) TaxID=479433 RepID=C7PXP1_CATAD|nr:hypothetical protein [Catenulispora acidiphila]ACU71494.1 hypothetical protein Caci_2576 [Catenulispora acidiphila DSM 44928]